MAFGRWDQLLYPLYRRDIDSGTLTPEAATELMENVFVKICERRFYRNADDVVNICIGGVDADGQNAVNDLSYRILEAVNGVHLPGPNLSARIAPDTPNDFLDACLKVIGTGLGYPALMNDTVNMAALRRYGYDEVDVRNYSMVGCIENFITGLQPPWSDGRFDTPRFLEYLLLDGEGFDNSRKGLKPPPLEELDTMDAFMAELERQLTEGVKEYMDSFHKRNAVPDPEHYTSPFLSCFCRCCIERGRDINMGGARYPSVHGAALMGVGTMSDALAAIEQTVFIDKAATLAEIAEAMRHNFAGHERLRRLLLAAPKYGNDHPLPDKYAVWFTSFLANEFDKYRTYDDGGIYIAMAANISNIDAGHRIGATPDGRLAGEPLSDAASPTYGRDKKGVTATLLSLSKPDYTYCACGTVVNQKLFPTMFEEGQRKNLIALIRVYFARGGQELQINATSTETLRDAMKHPERYASLVVRVSGFSALYVTLDKEVQEDILHRTEQT
jgi:formate C-acetyltransferase